MTKVVKLNVTTWAGTLVYAKHYYGKLQDGDTSLQVEWLMTTEQQRELNREDGVSDECVWEGRTCTRFDSKEKLFEEATKLAKARFGEDVILFVSQEYVDWQHNPSEMLFGPEPLRTKANEAWRDFEDKGGYGETTWTKAQEREAGKRAKAWRRIVNPVLRLVGAEEEP